MNNPLTPEDVRRIFDYEDGRLIWRENRAPRAKAGADAGSKGTNGQNGIRIDGVRYMRARLVWAWHRGTWPVHTVCHADHDSGNDAIDNLLDLDRSARRLLQRYKQRDLPPGVNRARHGYNFTACFDGAYQGSYKTADEAHAAYVAAHLAHFGSASPWATGGASMSNAHDSYSAPTESFSSENRDTAGATP